MSIDSPTLRLELRFCFSFSKAAERKGNRWLGWFRSLLFFWYLFLVSEIFSKYQRRNNLKSPLGLILLSFCLVICRFVSENNMVFFAVDCHVVKQQVVPTSLSTNKNSFFGFTHLDSTSRLHHITLGPVFVGQDSSWKLHSRWVFHESGRTNLYFRDCETSFEGAVPDI